MSTSRKSRVLLAVGGVAVVFLLAGVFTLGSLTLPFQPTDQVVLYALSMFLVAALVVFLFILARTLVRLGIERLAHKPGSRFKTKMVLGAIAVSFLPVIVLFFVSYALLNRTLVLWFPRPLEIATESSRALVNEMSRADADRMAQIAKEVAGDATSDTARDTVHAFDQAFARGADLAWEVNDTGKPSAVAVNPNLQFPPSPAGAETASTRRAHRPWCARCREARSSGNIVERFFWRAAPRRRVDLFLPGASCPMIFRSGSRKSPRKMRCTSSSGSIYALTKIRCWPHSCCLPFF